MEFATPNECSIRDAFGLNAAIFECFHLTILSFPNRFYTILPLGVCQYKDSLDEELLYVYCLRLKFTAIIGRIDKTLRNMTENAEVHDTELQAQANVIELATYDQNTNNTKL
ncbi:unnamed protein product [Rotaria socialis]|uniref:Uncharacterized protein n=1 Tax=Rotaria socialis TaxID=392032 RepID=A0A821GW56_9BILA|nr:unnamed protein product [Rotaria socialis]